MRRAVVPLAIGILLLALAGCSSHGKSNPPAPATNQNQAAAAPPTTTSLPVATNQNQSSSQFLTSIKMIDEQSGWAWNDGHVFHTADSGATWTKATPGNLQTSQTYFPYGYFFLDANTGWIAGYDVKGTPAVFRTVDGGKKWNSAGVDTKTFLTGATLDFLDSKNGWMMVPPRGTGAGSEPVDIYSTVDGGASWRLAYSSMPQDLLYGGDKTGLSFVDGQRGWVTGYYSGPGFLFYRTTDGGQTWSGQALSVPPGFHADGGAAETDPPVFDGASGLLPVIFHADGPSVVFYRTDDGGQTWEETTPLPLSASYSQIIWSIPDVKHAFVSDGKQLYASSDGGQTWTATTLNLDSGQTWQLDFINGSTGWLLGDNNFLRQTRDGGTIWIEEPCAGVS
jgi:photosystem II stability/assembly factor-like uncharacterized protein